MADNATLARSLYEAWNKRDFDFQSDCMTPEATIIDMGSGTTLRGPDGARQYNTAWADGFPDGKITVDRVLPSGDCVVVEYTGRGTHTGPLVTAAGTLPATGRSVTLHLCDIYDFSDGKIQTQRCYFDSGSLLAQLGVAAGQTATTR